MLVCWGVNSENRYTQILALALHHWVCNLCQTFYFKRPQFSHLWNRGWPGMIRKVLPRAAPCDSVTCWSHKRKNLPYPLTDCNILKFRLFGILHKFLTCIFFHVGDWKAMFTSVTKHCLFLSRVQGLWKMSPINNCWACSAVRDISVLRDYYSGPWSDPLLMLEKQLKQLLLFPEVNSWIGYHRNHYIH